MATYALTEKAVVLRPEDAVAVAKAELTAGTASRCARTSSPATRWPAPRSGRALPFAGTVR